ncbi:hypothetical protein [Gemmatimonas sp.]
MTLSAAAGGATFVDVGEAGKVADLVVVDFDAAETTGGAGGVEFLNALRAQRTALGGYVLLHCKSRVGGVSRSPVARVVRSLERCQLRPVRLYYVAPSLAMPMEFIPVDAAAVRSLESHTPRGIVRRSVRRVLIALGFHHVLFEDAVVVAKL